MEKKIKKLFFKPLRYIFFDSEMNYQSLLFAFQVFRNSHCAMNIKSFIIGEIGDELIEKVISS